MAEGERSEANEGRALLGDGEVVVLWGKRSVVEIKGFEIWFATQSTGTFQPSYRQLLCGVISPPSHITNRICSLKKAHKLLKIFEMHQKWNLWNGMEWNEIYGIYENVIHKDLQNA